MSVKLSKNHIKLAICDLNGVLRSKYISKEKFDKACQQGMGFCNVIVGSDIDDQLIDNLAFTGWQSGYPDAKIQILENTHRKLPLENNRDFILCEFDKANADLCSRSVLKSIIEQAQNMSLKADAGMEFEFSLFDENSHSLHEKHFQSLRSLTPGNFGYSLLRTSEFSAFYDELLACCDEMQIPLEGLHTEIGPGVLEAALQYSDILQAADNAIIFKSLVKTLAQRYGWTACFMAKWSEQNQGQSGHIHLSLKDMDDKSVFYEPAQPYNISNTMAHFIAGQQHLMPDFLCLSAPFINSFARLVPGFWAPTHATWGIDNRTCAIRVVEGNEKSQRLEYRIAGADANPYLAMAAALSSGIHGIKEQLKTTDPIMGNAYQLSSEQNLSLPTTLEQSALSFRNSEVAPLYFSQTFIKDYATTREWEATCYQKSVTDWQLKRYFELA